MLIQVIGDDKEACFPEGRVTLQSLAEYVKRFNHANKRTPVAEKDVARRCVAGILNQLDKYKNSEARKMLDKNYATIRLNLEKVPIIFPRRIYGTKNRWIVTPHYTYPYMPALGNTSEQEEEDDDEKEKQYVTIPPTIPPVVTIQPQKPQLELESEAETLRKEEEFYEWILNVNLDEIF
jgi:hypothetical protein